MTFYSAAAVLAGVAAAAAIVATALVYLRTQTINRDDIALAVASIVLVVLTLGVRHQAARERRSARDGDVPADRSERRDQANARRQSR